MSSSAISSSVIVPEALNNSNYKLWRACMKDYFSGQDLWDVVVDIDEDQTKSTTWKQKNGKALHAIKVSCGPKILSQIGFAERASDSWKQLECIQKNREKGTSESLHICIDIEPKIDEENDELNQLLMYLQEGKLRNVKEFINEHPEAVRSKITSNGGTALHAAIIAQQVEIVEFLVTKMELQDLKIEDNNFFTALDTIAAQVGDEESSLQMTKCIAPKHPLLVTHGNVFTPILIASARGHKDMTRYLYKIIVEAENALTRAQGRDKNDTSTILDRLDPEKGCLHGTILLSHCITGKMFDIASDLLGRFPKLAGKQCAFVDPIQELCKVPSAFPSGTRGFPSEEYIKSS